MTEQVTGRAQESGHWYDREGNAVYEIRGANGKMRSPHLGDARKLGLLPGVSSILRCAAAPGLERWKQQQVLLAALTLPRIENEPEEKWLDRILDDSKQQGIKAAEKGTAIHAAIQRHYEGRPFEARWDAHVAGVVDEVESRFGKQPWASESSFASRLGYGGKIDAWSDEVLLDFKTKEFGRDARGRIDKELVWDDHLIQMAGYLAGISGKNGAEGRLLRVANVFVSRDTPGLVHIHEWPVEDLVRGTTMFLALLKFWQAKNRYQSGW